MPSPVCQEADLSPLYQGNKNHRVKLYSRKKQNENQNASTMVPLIKGFSIYAKTFIYSLIYVFTFHPLK